MQPPSTITENMASPAKERFGWPIRAGRDTFIAGAATPLPLEAIHALCLPPPLSGEFAQPGGIRTGTAPNDGAARGGLGLGARGAKAKRLPLVNSLTSRP